MIPVIFYLSSHLKFKLFKHETADFVLRGFPDGESYLKINTAVKNREIIIVENLNQPNIKILNLLFLAKTLKDLGAKKITLACPYLGYLRQDKIFNPGEGLTSKYFAELISQDFNKIITLEPHLHRYKKLGEIYSIENTVLHATQPIAEYIKNTIKNPLIIGPDSESESWIKDIARLVNSPYVIAQKKRLGDYKVEIIIPDMEKHKNLKPVLIDDIISTAQTMIQAVNYLKNLMAQAPVCIGVHGIFADRAYEELLAAGPEKVITCNSIGHVSNQIDISDLLASAF